VVRRGGEEGWRSRVMEEVIINFTSLFQKMEPKAVDKQTRYQCQFAIIMSDSDTSYVEKSNVSQVERGKW
jgi:hypothetical protein